MSGDDVSKCQLKIYRQRNINNSLISPLNLNIISGELNQLLSPRQSQKYKLTAGLVDQWKTSFWIRAIFKPKAVYLGREVWLWRVSIRIVYYWKPGAH